MPARLLSVLIIGFWLVMTGLLARRVWFPEETRFAEISPEAVLELFASRSEPTQLEIYDNRTMIGKLRITPPSRAPGSQRPVRVNVDGDVRLGGALLPAPVSLDIRGRFLIGSAGELMETDLRLSVRNPGPRDRKEEPIAALRIDQDAQTPPRLRLFRGGALLIDSAAAADEKPESGAADPLVSVLLPLLGLTPDQFKAMLPASAGPGGLPAISARQGTFSFAAHPSFTGYLLTAASAGNTEPSHKFRAYLDAAGEILRVETPVGYVLTQEDLTLEGTPKPETPP